MTKEEARDIHAFMEIFKRWVRKGPDSVNTLTAEMSNKVQAILALMKSDPHKLDASTTASVVEIRDWMSCVKVFMEAFKAAVEEGARFNEIVNDARKENQYKTPAECIAEIERIINKMEEEHNEAVHH